MTNQISQFKRINQIICSPLVVMWLGYFLLFFKIFSNIYDFLYFFSACTLIDINSIFFFLLLFFECFYHFLHGVHIDIGLFCICVGFKIFLAQSTLLKLILAFS